MGGGNYYNNGGRKRGGGADQEFDGGLDHADHQYDFMSQEQSDAGNDDKSGANKVSGGSQKGQKSGGSYNNNTASATQHHFVGMGQQAFGSEKRYGPGGAQHRQQEYD